MHTAPQIPRIGAATNSTLFRRAEGRPDGGRAFKPFEGEPLPAKYGEDSYKRFFGVSLL